MDRVRRGNRTELKKSLYDDAACLKVMLGENIRGVRRRRLADIP